MPYGFAKALMAGSALSLAVGAVAYSHVSTVLPLIPYHTAAVSPDPLSSVDQSAAVLAFVHSTTLMARHVVAPDHDIAHTTTTRTAALDQGVASIPANEQNDDLTKSTAPRMRPESDGFTVRLPTMQPRPRAAAPRSVFAAHQPRPTPPAPKPTVKVKQATQGRKIRKPLTWSSGAFR